MPSALICPISGSSPPGSFFAVHDPVAQPLIVVIPGAEPAIVQHHHLHTERGRFFSNLYDLFGVEIKIGGLPVVDQHRAAFVLPRAAADVAPQKAVVLLGKRGQTLCRKGKDHLRGVKGLARLQVPCKALLLNAAHYPDQARSESAPRPSGSCRNRPSSPRSRHRWSLLHPAGRGSGRDYCGGWSCPAPKKWSGYWCPQLPAPAAVP